MELMNILCVIMLALSISANVLSVYLYKHNAQAKQDLQNMLQQIRNELEKLNNKA